jgi:hypothetical protein
MEGNLSNDFIEGVQSTSNDALKMKMYFLNINNFLDQQSFTNIMKTLMSQKWNTKKCIRNFCQL